MRNTKRAEELLTRALDLLSTVDEDRSPVSILAEVVGAGWDLSSSADAEGRWHYYLVAPEGWRPAPDNRPGWIDGTSKGRSRFWRSAMPKPAVPHPEGQHKSLTADDPANTERACLMLGLMHLTEALVAHDRWQAAGGESS